MSRNPLGKRTLFFYGLSVAPVRLASFPMMLYLNKFYATDMGIDLAALATILLLARVFDLITDPLVGYLSCLLYTSPSPRDVEESRMPSSA